MKNMGIFLEESIVWPCASRLDKIATDCTARTIREDAFQSVGRRYIPVRLLRDCDARLDVGVKRLRNRITNMVKLNWEVIDKKGVLYSGLECVIRRINE